MTNESTSNDATRILCTIPTTVAVTEGQARGLLCNALEGGSNYWYEIVGYDFPYGVRYEDFKPGGRFPDPEDYWHPAQLIPFHEGCAVRFSVKDDTRVAAEYRLDRPAIIKGIEAMAKHQPEHWRHFLDQDDDGDTGDVFLQCCLFGDVVYC